MKTILLADDSQFMRTHLKKMLQQYFYIVAEAEDGNEAIVKYKKYQPDIVLLDITMPNTNGITALKGIMSINPNAKVVMCSAIGSKFIVIEAIKEGATDFVVKPNFKGLIEILERISN